MQENSSAEKAHLNVNRKGIGRERDRERKSLKEYMGEGRKAKAERRDG